MFILPNSQCMYAANATWLTWAVLNVFVISLRTSMVQFPAQSEQ